MKVIEHQLSQCIRLFNPEEPQDLDNVSVLRLLRRCEERYGFFQGPRTLAEFDISKGITFLEGQFEKRLAIKKFQLFTNGVLAEGNASTVDLDKFLDDAVEWGRKEIGKPPKPSTRRAYLSQFVVKSEASLVRALPMFEKLAHQITESIRSYGQNTASFQVSGITMFADLAKVEKPKPGTQFIFARREGEPYGSDLYFAAAPLRTDHHLQYLTEFEKILTKMASAS